MSQNNSAQLVEYFWKYISYNPEFKIERQYNIHKCFLDKKSTFSTDKIKDLIDFMELNYSKLSEKLPHAQGKILVDLSSKYEQITSIIVSFIKHKLYNFSIYFDPSFSILQIEIKDQKIVRIINIIFNIYNEEVTITFDGVKFTDESELIEVVEKSFQNNNSHESEMLEDIRSFINFVNPIYYENSFIDRAVLRKKFNDFANERVKYLTKKPINTDNFKEHFAAFRHYFELSCDEYIKAVSAAFCEKITAE